MSEELKLAATVGEEMLAVERKHLKRMDERLSEAMLTTTMIEHSQPDEDIPGAEKIPAYAILKARLDWAKVQATPALMLFIACMCDRPGTVILYAAVIKALSKKSNSDTKVTLTVFAEKAFPWGFPSEEELNRIWEGQKWRGHRPDNSLDYEEAWEIPK